MYRFLLLAFLFFAFTGGDDFKIRHLENIRVKNAYAEKAETIKKALAAKGIKPETTNIFIRAFKQEKELEIWAKNKSDKKYQLIETYAICKTSGNLGPKKRQGDGQVPEGFNTILNFNPESKFHLSMSINYPNAYDRANCNAGTDLGNNICIHGNCVTIGCIPLTDDKIKEVYIYAVEAYNNGQKQIPVHIFPARLNDENYNTLIADHKSNKTLTNFWQNLHTGYQYFETNKTIPKITLSADGKYVFK
jgi:murein L,D-transpeptidase YafK